MKLLKWIIKMAKKLLNLNTDDGEQSWEDGSSLPSGTNNDSIRHNGTNWVANSKIQHFAGSSNYSEWHSGTTYYPTAQIGSFGAGGATVNCFYNNDNNIQILGSSTPQIIMKQGTIVFALISKSSTVINSTNVKFSSISGTGSAILEATSDGTIQRSATPLTKTKIINRVLTSASSIHSFDNTDLGITGDLTTKIFSFELLRKINGNDYFSLGELVQTEKTLTSSAVTFATGEIPSGDTIRLAITYID